MSVFVPRRIASLAEPRPEFKAGPTGSGAGVLMTEFPLMSILGNSPQKRMRKAYQMGITVPWIRAAERVIGGAFAGVPWHLEDENDVEIDDDYKGDLAQEARNLIAKPTAKLPRGQQMSRSSLWRITVRHMGLCGNAFHFLDAMDGFGIPQSIIYIRPDRMYPREDKAGNLLSWDIKDDPNEPGINVSLEQIMHFELEPPDEGHFGPGLVESALIKAQNATGLDRHIAQILAAGGRMAGIISPKEGSLGDPEFQQLIRDVRNIVEQPDAAKKTHIVRGPIEFTHTAMSQQELQTTELLTIARDDLLGLWGVPVSLLGIHDRGRGLGGAEVVIHDEATLWKNAIHPRLGNSDEGGFVEVVQSQLLDRFADAGCRVELEIDEPTFDDESVKFDEAQKAVNIPLKTSQRLEILGLEPFGPDAINPETGCPYDDEVWMPATMTRAFVVPSEGHTLKPEPKPEPVPAPLAAAALAAGETSDPAALGNADMPMGKKAGMVALGGTLKTLRTSMTAKVSPRLERAVAGVLDEQKAEVAQRIKTFATHIAAKPADTSIWWDGQKWDRKLRDAMRPHLAAVASTVGTHLSDALAPVGKADPLTLSAGAGDLSLFIENVLSGVLEHGAARVTAINERTRAAIQRALEQAVTDGIGPGALADQIELIKLDNGTPAFDEYRAELIGRTELNEAYRDSEINAYGGLGVDKVQAIDGDGDEMCASRNGQIYRLDEAGAEMEHPNGTLSFVPWID